MVHKPNDMKAASPRAGAPDPARAEQHASAETAPVPVLVDVREAGARRCAELLDHTFVFVCCFSPDGILLEANQPALAAAGVSAADSVGKPFTQINALSHSPAVTAQVRDLLRRGAEGLNVRAELTVRLAGGRMAVVDCMLSPLRDSSGRVVRIAGTGVEITARKRAEAALLKLNRELRMLINCNQVLVRAQSEDVLLADVCRVVVENGGYPLVWVGFAQNDAGTSVRAVAQAGADCGYLDSARISWADNERGQGPTGRAIRERTVQICRDIESDPAFAPWRDEAQRRGYFSSIALPLLSGTQCLGALTIYSGSAEAFQGSEVELLAELARDLAYGIDALRVRAEHERLTRVLRLQSGINAAVLRIRDRNELLQEACRLAAQVGGYEHVAFFLMDADGRARPRFRAGAGPKIPEVPELLIGDGTEPDMSLSSRALRTGEVVVCSDLKQSGSPVVMRERLIELGYKSIVALPLIVGGRRVGVLTLLSRDAKLVHDEELLLLQDVMASLSFALRSQEQADTAQFLSQFDPMTGLANRTLFCERLDSMLVRRGDLAKNPVVVVFDVHNLNHLNDSFGRRFGDLVLQKVAERLKRLTEGDERIGYLGAGVFVLVELQLESGDRGISSLLESGVFSEPFFIEGRTLRLSFSSGVAHFPTDGPGAETLVQRAEAALKKAKDSGEQYVHFNLEIHSEIAERLELEHKLRAAMDEQQFEVYYQPQINIASGRIESLEALIRWNDPQRGVVLPGSFLSVLESSGLIAKVGDWVLGKAADACERWSRLRLGPVRVAVNVSPLQLRQRTFVRSALDMQRRIAANPGFGLDLEITETTLLQDVEGASRKLRELRAAGVRIALDDFGTAYSSLGLLSKLPVDLVKIDRSFVHGMPGDPASVLLVESITRLAHGFGLITVAEGVETPEQLQALRNMGCDVAQGYLHSPPVPLQKVEILLANDVVRGTPILP